MKSKKPKIKLVISDVDGTLVAPGEESLPTKAVIDAINHLHQKGIIVCLATGRALLFVANILKVIPLKSYIIVNGGSEIYDTRTKKYVWKKILHKNHAKKILKYLDEKGFRYGYYDNGLRFTSSKDAKTWLVAKIHVADLTHEQVNQIKKELGEISDIHIVIVDNWTDKSLLSLNITHREATKQYAVYQLLKILKINRKHALGIGDSDNDLPLFAACNIKVAMGNAGKQLKDIADWVAPPFWENGFAAAMEKFVL